jgi:hypothetical protein
MTLLEIGSCILDQVPQNQSLSEDSGSQGLRLREMSGVEQRWVFAGISFKLPLWGTLSMNRTRVNSHGRKGSGLRDALGGEKVSPFLEV